ncbi:p-hydroxycinnamate MFS transporter [Rhodococcus sp. NPDC127530]|uniref:p-hydroxycinnamate MFS transporter n=1 Tax=unclassified Rhodococcus (in: high G+C Gram-positive bacteria) TaxID=192944 RepID=UPI003626A788
MTVTATAGTMPATQRKKEVRRVILSSYLGSTIEFYDFLLYATAASLVFGPVFFADLDPLAASIASMGTFAAGYVARPLGGIVFGHFGDTRGRKAMLLISMTVMGTASFAIGLIPPPEMIGSWAAVILVILRVCQGLAVGGEWGGAALMSLEHAESGKRGFAAAFTNAGAPTGALLGTLALAAVSLLPDEQFLTWGWRIPFLISAFMLALGLFIRSKVSESPLFTAALKESAKKETTPPIVTILKRPRAVVVASMSCIASFGMQTAFTTFAITYAVSSGAPRSDALLAFSFCQFCAIFLVLGSARLSDRIGRRPVMLAGLGAMILSVYPLFLLLSTGQFPFIALAFVGYTICHSATYGPMAAFISEQFGTRARYTGASLGYQLATLIGAGFTPVILASLFASSGKSILPVGLFIIALCVVSAVFLVATKESKDNDLSADTPSA